VNLTPVYRSLNSGVFGFNVNTCLYHTKQVLCCRLLSHMEGCW